MSSTSCLEDQQRALLAEISQVESVKAQLFAREMRLRARMDRLWNPPVVGAQEQFGVLELAGTARIGQTRAASQLVNGPRLVQDLPGTLAALEAGVMFRESAVLLLELTGNCTPEVVRELERRLLPTLLTANTTELRRLVLAAIPQVEADLDPALTEQRLADARARRSVWQADRQDGMVDTTGQMDVLSAKRWALDFHELVRAQKLADDKAGIVRTADQRQADVFAQLPSRFLALLQAIQRGHTTPLLALALADPDLADQVEAIAATLPEQPTPTDQPTPTEQPTPPDDPAADEHSQDLGTVAEPQDPELLGLLEVRPEACDGLEPWRTEQDRCSSAPAEDPSEDLSEDPSEDLPEGLAEPPPTPAQPPPDPAGEPDPRDPALIAHWTELSLLELAATVMGLPVRNPLLLNVHVPMSTALELDNRSGRIDQGAAGAGQHRAAPAARC